jgi:hypothetical protein
MVYLGAPVSHWLAQHKQSKLARVAAAIIEPVAHLEENLNWRFKRQAQGVLRLVHTLGSAQTRLLLEAADAVKSNGAEALEQVQEAERVSIIASERSRIATRQSRNSTRQQLRRKHAVQLSELRAVNLRMDAHLTELIKGQHRKLMKIQAVSSESHCIAQIMDRLHNDYKQEVLNAQNEVLLHSTQSKHVLTQRLKIKHEREQLQLEMAQKLASLIVVAKDHSAQVGKILGVSTDITVYTAPRPFT